jgi:hypothetical protein
VARGLEIGRLRADSGPREAKDEFFEKKIAERKQMRPEAEESADGVLYICVYIYTIYQLK